MRLVIGSLRQQESFYISNSTKSGRLGRVKLKRAGEVAQVKGPHLRFGLFSNWIEGPWACFCKGGLVASLGPNPAEIKAINCAKGRLIFRDRPTNKL